MRKHWRLAGGLWRRLRARLPWRLIGLLAAVAVIGLSAAHLVISYVGRRATEPPVLNIAILGEPSGLNPLVLSSQAGSDVARLFFDPLVYVDGAGSTGPGLATTWTSADAGRTWTVRLRSGVTWHDGRRFGADDVVFTYAALADVNFDFNAGGFWRGLQVVKVDDLTVRFTPPSADVFFPWRLTVPILPRGQLAGVPYDQWPTHPTALKPVGTGPYVFEDRRPGQSLSGRANPGYWAGAPAYARVTVHFYAGHEVPSATYASRAVDAGPIGPAQVCEATKSAGFRRGTEVVSRRGSSYFFIALNLKAGVGFFDDPRVRQALSLALDRQRVLEAAGLVAAAGRKDSAYPLASPFPPEVWPNVGREGPSTASDPGRARSLLKAAGWKDGDGDGVVDRGGRPLRFTLLAPEEPSGADTRLRASREVAAQWRKVGVAAEVKAVSLADLFAAMAPPFNYEALLGRFILAPDPDVADVFASNRVPGVEPDGYLTGGANFMSYRDSKVDGLFAEAAQTTDPAALQQIYLQLQDALMADSPLLVLWGDLQYHVVPRGMKGFDPGPFGALWNIGRWQPSG